MQLETGGGVQPDTFYHGTSIPSALKIQASGFHVGPNSGLMGCGVYVTTCLDKAMVYARSFRAGGVITVVRVDLGTCKKLAAGDPMMKTWHLHGFDSAWAPNGANSTKLSENCITDPKRVTLLRCFPGDTGQLKTMGLTVCPNGRLETVSAGRTEGAGKRKHAFVCMDSELLLLLTKYELHYIADQLADLGIQNQNVLMRELPACEVDKLPIGYIYQTRLKQCIVDLCDVHAKNCKLLERAAVLLAQLSSASSKIESEVACWKLTQLCDSMANNCALTTFFTTEIVPAVLHVMSAWANSIHVQNHGCNVLLKCILHNDDGQTASNATLAVTVLLTTMRTHAQDAELLYKCVYLMHRHAIVDKNAFLSVAVPAGFIPLAIAQLKAHPRQVQIVSRSALLLNDMCTTPEHRIAIASADGIPTMLAALQAHMASQGARESVCAVLHTMASNSETHSYFLQTDVIACLTTVMAAHESENWRFQYNLVHVLFHLSMTPGACAAMGNTGLVKLLLDGMSAYPNAHVLHIISVQLLVRMQQHAGVLKHIADAGAVSVLIASMTLHMQRHANLETACILLAILVTHHYLRGLDSDGILGVITPVMLAIKTHPTVITIAKTAIHILLVLCQDDFANIHTVMVQHGVLPLMTAALYHHSNVPNVCDAAVKMICDIAQSGTANRLECKRTGVVPVLTDFLARNVGSTCSASVQTCLQTLAKL